MSAIGMITGEADGAFPNGSRVRKVNSQPDDTHGDGAPATVLSSFGAEFEGAYRLGYFVEWDDQPGVPVMVADFRLELVSR